MRISVTKVISGTKAWKLVFARHFFKPSSVDLWILKLFFFKNLLFLSMLFCPYLFSFQDHHSEGYHLRHRLLGYKSVFNYAIFFFQYMYSKWKIFFIRASLTWLVSTNRYWVDSGLSWFMGINWISTKTIPAIGLLQPFGLSE